MEQHDTHRGARVGTRIAHLVSQAIVYTHSKLLDVKHKLAVMVFNTISNEISDEVDTTLGPLLKGMASAYEQGGPLEGMMHFMAHGRGQFKAIVGSSTTAQSLLWALGTVISNELAPIAYGYIGENPHLVPDPATLATFAATGRMAEDDAIYGIRQNGFFDHWGKSWIDAAKSYPPITDLLDWRRKGLLSTDDFITLSRKAGYDKPIADKYEAGDTSQISFQDKALAYLRGMVDKEQVYSAAREQGILSGDVDVYLDTIGEPPGTMDMLEAFRRGFINEQELERGILQSRVRNEWIPLIKELRYSPMSTADAVNAVVQGHIPYAEGQHLADENGLLPGQFDVLYQTAGAPLSRTELNDLYNRGEIGSDVVRQGLRESRLKDKYVDDAFALRRRLLEPRSLGEAVVNGAITHDEAIRKAMEHGYTKDDATILVAAASNRKLQSYREHLVNQLETLYMDGAYTQEQVIESLKGLGHSDEEARMLTQTADYKREQRAFNGATTVIRNKYVAHHIDRGTASNMLDGIGMRATQRDYYLSLWGLEAAANVKELTPAQILRAIKLQSITPDEGLQRLVDMGYKPADAALLIQDI